MADDTLVAAIIGTGNRKSLFHFTRVRNLAAIADCDALLSSSNVNPDTAGERRVKAIQVTLGANTMTLNAHLRIPDQMIDPSTTQEQFRVELDRHVFFWPTWKDCQKMLDTYTRREPEERFAVLQLDAYTLLKANAAAVKLSKYDSGSAPRFPHRCSYKKSKALFLPLNRFKLESSPIVPGKASEIREVLIEDKVTNLSEHLQAVYVDHVEDVPANWLKWGRALADIRAFLVR